MQVLSFEEKIRLKTLQAQSTRTISCIAKISQGKSLILSQHGRCTAERDLSALKDVHPVRKRERAVDMLLDQNNTGPPTANLWKDFKELVNNLGSKSQESSSSSSSSGSETRARAIATICCCPPDNLPASAVFFSLSAGKSS